MNEASRCCHMLDGNECQNPATWHLTLGPAPDDYTEACDDHAGHLAEDGAVLTSLVVAAV